MICVIFMHAMTPEAVAAAAVATALIPREDGSLAYFQKHAVLSNISRLCQGPDSFLSVRIRLFWCIDMRCDGECRNHLQQ